MNPKEYNVCMHIDNTIGFDEWKNNNPNDYFELCKMTRDVWLDISKDNQMNDIAWMSPSKDKNKQVYTFQRVIDALKNENDCFEDLIKLQFQFIKYKQTYN